MYKLFLYALIISAALWSASCKKMDSTYKDFVVPGGLVYPGKAVNAKARSGHNRVMITWLRGSDPSITKGRIFWNNYTDSLEVAIMPGTDTIRQVVDNLADQAYTFIVKTYNKTGDASVPVELQVNAYGEKYQASLLSRPVKVSLLDLANTLTIEWGGADISNGAVATEVTYTANDDQQKAARFLVGEPNSVITDVKPGTAYQYTTIYLPDSSSIDTFYTTPVQQGVSAKIDKTAWTATTDSYAATSQLPLGGPPEKAIDDDINTFWHTDHTANPRPPFPHWLAVDMKRTYTVTAVELTCRPNVTNTFTEFTIQGSNDGLNWVSYDSFILIQQNPTQRFFISGAPQMSYIRIYATKGPNAYANLAEFSVIGY